MRTSREIAVPEAVGIDAGKLTALLARARREVDEGLLPACQVAVAKDGCLVAFETYGDASSRDRFLMYSSTKGFVAAAVWKLLSEEQLRVEQRVAELVPEFGSSGKDAITKLASGVKLGSDTTYVHCGGWNDTEWKMVADSGGTVSFSPGTEMVMGIINPPIQQALDAGLRPSLSADAETNAPNDMFTEMRLALASQNAMLMVRRDRGEQNLPKRLTVRDALEFATIEGAKANGLAAKVGSLTPGKQADVICLRKDRINVMPVNDPVGAVVLGMDTSNVDTVFVAGKAKKRNGELLGVDLKRVAAEAIASRDYLAAKVRAG